MLVIGTSATWRRKARSNVEPNVLAAAVVVGAAILVAALAAASAAEAAQQKCSRRKRIIAVVVRMITDSSGNYMFHAGLLVRLWLYSCIMTEATLLFLAASSSRQRINSINCNLNDR